MLRGLRVLAVSVPILVSLAVSIVLAAPGKMTTNIKPTMTNQTRDLAPIQSDIVRVFAR